MKKNLFILLISFSFSLNSYGDSREEIIDNPLFDTSSTRWKVLDDDYAAIQGSNNNSLLELIKDKNGCHIDYLSGVRYEKPLDKFYDYIFTTEKNGYVITVKHDFHPVGGEGSEEYRHSLRVEDTSKKAQRTLVSLFSRASRDDISSSVRISYGLTRSDAVADGSYRLDQQLFSFGEFSLYHFIDAVHKLGCD